MFDVTVYTDVRSDEALDGIAGFNFLTESEGITAVDRRFITQRMLHVVKPGWHVDHSDELSHPPTCIYRKSNGRYFLSRGRSIGQTVTAPRPGNQLTQTLVTSSPDDFVPYRPAQLYAATQWNLSRQSQGKESAAWPTPLEIETAYEADELKADLIDGSPFGVGFLPRFLTMVEEAVADPGKKLIIVHTELDVVMRYIAFASLFLDARRALQLSFAAFADQPIAAVANIVGATPDFGATPDVNSGGSAYSVLDLLAVQMTSVEVSASATRQAEWFLAGDPLDALAAIDLARRWEHVLGPEVATDAAGLVSFSDRDVAVPRGRAAALRAVSGLVASGLADELAMYADELLDAIVTSPPSSEEDIVLAADAIGASHRVQMDDVATGILLPTVEALASRPDLISAWANETGRWQATSGPLTWESSESRDHALEAQTSIVNGTRPADLASILVAAKHSGLLPDDRAIASALNRLGDYWCEHPELSERKEELPYQFCLGPRLTHRIVSGLERNDQQVVRAFVAGEWNWLIGTGSPLEAWRSAAAVGAMALDRRADEIAAQGAQFPLQGWRMVLAGADMPAGAPAVAEWVSMHPDIPADLGAWIFKGLKASQAGYQDSRAARRVVLTLLGKRANSSDPALTQLISDTEQINRLYNEARRASGDERNPALHDFATRVAPYAGFFSPDIGELLVTAQDQRAAQLLERAIGDWAAPCIEEALKAIAHRARDADAVEWALNLYDSGTEVQKAAGLDYLVGLTDSRIGRERLDEARKHLAPSWIPVLEKLVEESGKGRLTRNVVRGGKRLFSKER